MTWFNIKWQKNINRIEKLSKSRAVFIHTSYMFPFPCTPTEWLSETKKSRVNHLVLKEFSTCMGFGIRCGIRDRYAETQIRTTVKSKNCAPKALKTLFGLYFFTVEWPFKIFDHWNVFDESINGTHHILCFMDMI